MRCGAFFSRPSHLGQTRILMRKIQVCVVYTWLKFTLNFTLREFSCFSKFHFFLHKEAWALRLLSLPIGVIKSHLSLLSCFQLQYERQYTVVFNAGSQVSQIKI